MKGIILAGGMGTRLLPLTRMMNKHLLPVGRKPMILYGIEKLKEAGITDILIVMGKQSSAVYIDFLGSGQEWGVQFYYNIQEESGGIAQALSHAENFISENEKFIVLLGDNLFEDSLKNEVAQFTRQEKGARVLLKKVSDPRRYGVPKFHQNTISYIEEKPEQPQSHFCVTGIYMYDCSVFEFIRRIKPSSRGELEITDVNNIYAREGTLTYGFLNGWWTDAGTFESLAEAGKRLSSGDGI